MNHRIIEIKQLRGECRTVEVEPDNVVYIADLIESQVAIKGKCMKVVAIDIQRSIISVGRVTSTVEIARAKNSLFVLENTPLTVLEQCVECRIGAVAQPTELRIRRSISLSLVVLKDIDTSSISLEELDDLCRNTKEEPLPDEIQVLLENNETKSSIVKNV